MLADYLVRAARITIIEYKNMLWAWFEIEEMRYQFIGPYKDEDEVFIIYLGGVTDLERSNMERVDEALYKALWTIGLPQRVQWDHHVDMRGILRSAFRTKINAGDVFRQAQINAEIKVELDGQLETPNCDNSWEWHDIETSDFSASAQRTKCIVCHGTKRVYGAASANFKSVKWFFNHYYGDSPVRIHPHPNNITYPNSIAANSLSEYVKTRLNHVFEKVGYFDPLNVWEPEHSEIVQAQVNDIVLSVAKMRAEYCATDEGKENCN